MNPAVLWENEAGLGYETLHQALNISPSTFQFNPQNVIVHLS